MNARQRRGVLFITFSVLMATVVFFTVAAYVARVNTQVGERVSVYRAATAIEPYQPLTEENLRVVRIPKRWASATSRLSLEDLRGRKVGFRLEKDTTLTSDMLVPPSDLSPTERELAVNVNAVTGLAGRVVPGNLVDIYAVFGDVPGLPKQVRVLVRNVRVVTVGGSQSVRQSNPDTGVASDQTVLPVTLALEPNDALAVTFASAFAEEVRLVGLPTGDTLNRKGEAGSFDAGNLGGQAIPEGGR